MRSFSYIPMPRYFGLMVCLIFLSACNFNFLKDQKLILETSKIPRIVFSHNLNGEIEPCGCRFNPLGGIPQVASALTQMRRQSTYHTLYLDAGDSLFPGPVVTGHFEKSLSFQALNLAKAFDMVKMDFWVPGEYDFARGSDFFFNALQLKNYSLFVSNFNENTLKDTKRWDWLQGVNNAERPRLYKWYAIHAPKVKIFMVSLVNPALFPSLEEQRSKDLFKPPQQSLKEMLKLLAKEAGYKSNRDDHKLILLSHLGMVQDKRIANHFPEVDWIIGSHDQAFTQVPEQVGKTKIVQVLARNHYLGILEFPNSAGQFRMLKIEQDKFNDKHSKALQPFIASVRKKRKDLLMGEQTHLSKRSAAHQKRHTPTAQSCRDCHDGPYKNWARSDHSLAYLTLLKKNEHLNPSCIGCHSLGYEGPTKGASALHYGVDIFHDEEGPLKDQAYFQEVQSRFLNFSSVRELGASQVHALRKGLDELNEKHQLAQDYSNVQCLHCHFKDPQHPFEDPAPKKQDPFEKLSHYKTVCLNCHTPEQSPHWFRKAPAGERELSAEYVDGGSKVLLDENRFIRYVQKISCARVIKKPRAKKQNPPQDVKGLKENADEKSNAVPRTMQDPDME